MAITIPDELVPELKNDISRLMHIQDDVSLEYYCGFCISISNDFDGKIEHEPDCLGLKLLKLIETS